jgi:HEAT repeat protein
MRIGQDLLDRVDESESEIEEKLWMVLEAIAGRSQAGALELIVSALVSEKTRRKEQYVDLLDRFEDPRTIPALMYAVEADFSTGEMGGWIRSKAINALLRLKATEAASMIIPYVKDSIDQVRSVAIKFLIDLNVLESAPVFVEQLAKEDDPDNFEDLISGLVLWKRTESLPVLANLLASDWVQADEDMKVVVKDAILELEQIRD